MRLGLGLKLTNNRRTDGALVFPTISSMFTRYEADYEENVDGSVSYNFAPSDVNTSTNRITITGLPAKAWVALTAPNGTPLYFSSTGTLPGGLVADTPYYLKLVSTNVFEVYPEASDRSQPGILSVDDPIYPAQNFAQSTNIVDLTTQGTGTHTVYSEDLIKILKDMTANGFDSEAYDLNDVNSYFERFVEGNKTYLKQRAIVRDWSTGVDARSGKLYPQGPAAPTGPSGYRTLARAAVAGARYVWHAYVMRPLKIEIHGAKKASGNTSAIDTTNDVISTQDIADGTGAQNHGLATGDEVKFIAHTGATLPAGISAATTYYVRIGDQAGANTTRKFRIYPTLVDANADTNKINITDTGTGTWTVYAPKRVAESIRHSRFLLEQLSPDSSSDALSPLHLEDPIQCNVAGVATSLFNPGASSNGDVGGPGLSLQGNRKGDRVYIWYPPESTPPTRSDTAAPLASGYYYISYKPGSTNMVRLHDTNASAVGADGIATASLADDGDAVGGCIKYSAYGDGEALIQSAWLDGVGPGVATDDAFGGSKTTFSDCRLPEDFCVVVYMIDYEPDTGDDPISYVYLNGALIEEKASPTTGGTKGRLSASYIEDQAAWKFGNSSAGHVCADADYVAVYLGAETGDTSPEDELLDLMDYAIARWGLSAPPVLSINRTAPSISGTAVQGNTLTGDKGRWNGYPLPTYSYRWLADGVAISGATGLTYVLTASEVGKVITFEVTATNTAGAPTATSTATSSVLPPVSAPSNTVAPVVSGTARVGDDLSVTTGTWVANPSPPTYAYQWVNTTDGDISGATSNSYTLQSGDQGDTVYCRVTATNAQGSNSANSNSTGTVAAAPALSIPVHSIFVALGDQITAQSTARGTRNWVNWATFLLNGKLRPAVAANQGKNGDTMTAMNTRIANITGQKPAIVFLNCGRGDGFATALATLQSRLDTLLASIWAADSTTIVIAQAALPASGDNGTALTRISDFNTYLSGKANLSGSNRLVYAPVPSGWDPTDGVHTSGGTIPNTAGAHKIAKALVTIMGGYVASGDVLTQTTAFGTFGANTDTDYSLTGTGGTKTATAGTVTGNVADGKEVTNLTTADIACSVSSGVQTLTISGTATATTVQFDEAAGSNASISVPSGYYAESLIGVTISAADGTSAPVGLRSFIDNIGQGAFGSTTADTGYGDLPEAVTGVMRTWPAFSTTTAASLNAQIQFLLAAVTADVKITLSKPIMRRVDLAARHTPFYVGGDGILSGAATCRITGTQTVGSTLTCGLGTWSGSLITYTYQWKNNTVDIGGATSATYVVQAGDSGDTITCVVTATNSFGATSQTTAGVVIA